MTICNRLLSQEDPDKARCADMTSSWYCGSLTPRKDARRALQCNVQIDRMVCFGPQNLTTQKRRCHKRLMRFNDSQFSPTNGANSIKYHKTGMRTEPTHFHTNIEYPGPMDAGCLSQEALKRSYAFQMLSLWFSYSCQMM